MGNFSISFAQASLYSENFSVGRCHRPDGKHFGGPSNGHAIAVAVDYSTVGKLTIRVKGEVDDS